MKRLSLIVLNAVVLFAFFPAFFTSCAGNEVDDANIIIPVSEVCLNPTTLVLEEGKSATITVSFIPENATNKNVSWISTNDVVASVISGVVNAKKSGTADIIVSTEDGGKTAICKVSVNSATIPSITVGAEKVTAVSVLLSGKAQKVATVGSDFEMGIMYSTSSSISPSNSKRVKSTNISPDYDYCVGITQLNPNTTYYYCSYAINNGQETNGSIKDFTTKELSSMIETYEPSEIKASSATLFAKLDLSDVQYSNITYGFNWGDSEGDLKNSVEGGTHINNTFKSLLSPLSHQTRYWYKAFVELDEVVYYGDVKPFTTGAIPVQGVRLDKNNYVFHTIGNTMMLNATVLPEDASEQSVEWSSENNDVATVDADGKVVAVGNGTTKIVVTTTDQRKTDECVITVAQYVTGLSLDNSAITLSIGQSRLLTATVIPDNAYDKTIVWTTSDPSVVSVDENGIITARSKGEAIVTALANDGSGIQATCTVTVEAYVTSIELDSAILNIYEGKKASLKATVYPEMAENKTLDWSSSDESIATVSSTGIVSALAPGEAIITVSATDGSGVKNNCHVQVLPAVKLSLNWSSVNLIVGEEEDLIVSVSKEGIPVKWSSSVPSIVAVQYGHIRALSTGASIVTVYVEDEPSFSTDCIITVIDQSSVSIEHILYLGETLELAATYFPEGGNVVWKSLDKLVATVSANGVVSPGEQLGEAIIVGRNEDGSKTVAVRIIVKKKYTGGGGGNEGIGEGNEI